MIRRTDPISRLFWFRYRLPGGRQWRMVMFRRLETARYGQRLYISYGWDVEPIRIPEAPHE